MKCVVLGFGIAGVSRYISRSDDSLGTICTILHSVTAQGQQRYLCHHTVYTARNVLLLPGAGCLAVVEVTRSLLSAILICSLC